MRKNKPIHYHILKPGLLALSLIFGCQAVAQAEPTKAELMQQLEAMSKELAATKAALRESERKRMEMPSQKKLDELESTIANAADTGPSKITPGDLIPALEGLTIGGAIRANYAVGDYGDGTGGPSRASDDGGDISLDTFRINADYTNGQFVAKFEYRFYPGYQMLHTGWVGYNFDNAGQVQVGVNRVPFGPGAYGISQSWFVDQHYYIGLSDDMDLGIKYSDTKGNLSFDLAYYYSDEGQWAGDSRQAARFSYDLIDESGSGYEERNQLNARVIYTAEMGEATVDLGFSAQFGQLESNGPQDDGHHYAFSVHPVFKWNNWTLATQLTKYEYDVDAAQPLGTDDLVQFGAFDFPTTVAAEAWIAGASLSYYHEFATVDWIDYVIPYVEYSSIIKEESRFNDSDLMTIGAAWGRGGWFIYTELAASNGNDFVGGENGFNSRFGANPNDDWQSRFNVNLGYYF